jgi:polar amino acid transport system substrate-binding protein
MFKKISLGVVAALAAVSLFASPGKDEKGLTIKKGVLSIGQEIGYPPFEYYGEDGKTPTGFDVEMGKALGAKLGFKVEFVDTAWDGIFAAVTKGDFDCIISAVTWTPERDAVHNFTKPYIGNAQCIVVLKGNKQNVNGMKDLIGKSVSYQGETTSDIFLANFAKANNTKFTVYEYEKIMSCFDELKLGRVDTVLCDSLVAADYVRDANAPFEVVWQGEADEVFAVCMQKGNDTLTAALDNALDELFADGAIQALSQKYFGKDLVTEAHNKKL